MTENEKIKFENEISDKVKIEFENDHERFVASVPEKFFLDAVDKAFEFTEINWRIIKEFPHKMVICDCQDAENVLLRYIKVLEKYIDYVHTLSLAGYPYPL